MGRKKRGGGKVPVGRTTRSSARLGGNVIQEDISQSPSESEESGSSGTPKSCNTPIDIDKSVQQSASLLQHKKFGKFRCLADDTNKTEISSSESEIQLDQHESETKESENVSDAENITEGVKSVDIAEGESSRDELVCSGEIVQDEVAIEMTETIVEDISVGDTSNDVQIPNTDIFDKTEIVTENKANSNEENCSDSISEEQMVTIDSDSVITVLKDVELNDKEVSEMESMDVESKDMELKDIESVERESKDIESKDMESKDIESKDSESKDIELKDIETKDVVSEINSDNSNASSVRRSSRIRSISVLKQKSKGRGVVRSEKIEKKDKMKKIEMDNNSDSSSAKENETVSLPLDSPSFVTPNSTLNSDQKPVKVKSRWRRSSELEMNTSPLISTPLISPQAISETTENTNDSMDIDKEDSKSYDEDMEERLRHFQTLTENEYLTERTSCREAKKMLCDCFLVEDEIERGEFGCGDDCLNRLLMIECGTHCVVGERCTNKRFQKLQYAPCEVFRTKKKGFGIKATADISAGDFILEYVGEVLDQDEFDTRAKDYSKDKNRHYYFMALRSDAVIDATQKGNISRFINHSCDPNAETQKWTVNGELRIGFFSTRSISAGEEITFDYQFQRYGKEAQKCYCEASTCRGWIGEEPESDEEGSEIEEEDEEEDPEEVEREKEDIKEENTQEKENKEPVLKIKREPRKKKHIKKPRKDIFDDLDLDEEIEMLASTGVKNQTHTLKLSRLMVRAKEMGPRMQLLTLLWQGEEPCRRLFLDYHGLRLIHGWMCDVNSLNEHDNILYKMEILKALDSLPIKNRTILQDSKVLSIVEKWAAKNDANSPTDSDNSPRDTQNANEIKKEKIEVKQENVEEKLEELDNKLDSITDIVKMDIDTEIKIDKMIVDGNSLEVSETVEVTVSENEEKNEEELEEKVTIKDILALCLKLLERWLLLKEDFRIPKKERIKQMKEHEREADRGYNAGLEDSRDVSRYSSRANKYREEKEKKKKQKEKKDHDRNTSRKIIQSERKMMSIPQLTKHERRQLFALQVQQEEEGRKRKQQELWRQHEQRCLMMGQNPRLVPFDPNFPNWNSNMPTNSWQQNFSPNVPPNMMPNISNIPPNVVSSMPPNMTLNMPPNMNPNIPPNMNPNMTPNINTMPPNMNPNMTPNINNMPPNMNTNMPPIMNPNMPHNMNPNMPPNMNPNMASNIPPPNILHNMPPNMNPNMPPNLNPNMPSNMNPNIPPNMNPNMAPNMNPNMPPNMNPNIPTNMNPNMPPNMAPNQQIYPSHLPMILPQVPKLNQNLNGNGNPALPQYHSPQPCLPKEEPFVPPLPPPPPVKLPPKWKCAKDKYGRPYYYHIKIRISQWIPPEFPPPVEEIQQAEEATETSSSSDTSSLSSDSSSESDEDDLDDTKLLLEIRNKLKAKEIQKAKDARIAEDNILGHSSLLHVETDERLNTIVECNIDTSRKEIVPKRKREGLVQEIIISPRTEEDKMLYKVEAKKYKETKEKLKRQKELLLEQTKKKLKAKAKQEKAKQEKVKQEEKDKQEKVKPTKKHRSIKVTKLKNIGSIDMNTEDAKKIREVFRKTMATVMVQNLNAYRKPDCKVGRITNTEDFKHLARKLTHFVMVKELKHCQRIEDLTCNESVKVKAKDFIRKYMQKFGEVYSRPKDEIEY